MFIRKRFLATLLALFILAGSAMTIAALVIPSAQSLLTQAIDSLYEVQDGHLVAEFEFNTPQQQGEGTVEAWGQLNVGPNGEPAFRLTVLSASEPRLAGLTAVSDGVQFWLYNAAENKVITGAWADLQAQMAARAAAHDHDDFDWDEWDEAFPRDYDFDPTAVEWPQTTEEAVAKLLEYFSADRTGTVEIGGSRAYTIRLVPIAEQMPDEVRAAGGYLNVWVRVSDSAPLGLEYVQGVPGSFRLAATTLTLNQGLDASLFTFVIPDGAEVVPFDEIEPPAKPEAAADFTPLTATDLPEGSELLEAAVVRGAAVSRYQLDGAEFYIAQGPPQAAADLFRGQAGETISLRGQEASLFQEEDGGRLLLTWSENGVSFWIGGQLSAEQALAIAESLQ